MISVNRQGNIFKVLARNLKYNENYTFQVRVHYEIYGYKNFTEYSDKSNTLNTAIGNKW